MSTSIDSSLIGKPISFVVYAPNILTSSFTNVKLLGILDAASALKEQNVAQLHAIVYPTIPDIDKPADDFNSYPYLKLQMQNGQIAVIGLPWINGAITEVSYQTLQVLVGNVSGNDVAAIRNLLISNGYTVTEISLVA